MRAVPFESARRFAATDARPELRDGAKAVAMASRACQLTGQKSPSMLLTLAAACGEAGRFGDALTTLGEAKELAKTRGEQGLATEAEKLRAAPGHFTGTNA